MNTRGFSLPLAVLFLCGIALGCAGVVFLAEATTSSSSSEQLLRNRMTAGIVCLSLASVFVIFGTVMAIVSAHLRRIHRDPRE